MAHSTVRHEVSADLAATALKSSVAIGTVGATIFGFTIQEAAAIFGALFILAQLAYLAWKWRGEYVDRKEFRDKLMKPAEPKE